MIKPALTSTSRSVLIVRIENFMANIFKGIFLLDGVWFRCTMNSIIRIQVFIIFLWKSDVRKNIWEASFLLRYKLEWVNCGFSAISTLSLSWASLLGFKWCGKSAPRLNRFFENLEVEPLGDFGTSLVNTCFSTFSVASIVTSALAAFLGLIQGDCSNWADMSPRGKARVG